MTITIRDNQSSVKKVILYIIAIVVVVAIVYVIWVYVYIPYRNGKIALSSTVQCTSAPSPPTGLQATAEPNNRAYIKWTATAKADSYILYVGNYSSFGLADAERVIEVKGESIMILNLVPKTYYFKLKAVNTCGTSSLSAETPLVITTWPSSFRLCKRDSPNVCLLMQSDGAFARMAQDCTSDQCVMEYQNQQNIKRYGDNICLEANDQPGADIETPVTSITCGALTTAWNIDIPTGRITNAGGLCFGANSTGGSTAYNTQCSVISNPADARYAWDVIALTN